MIHSKKIFSSCNSFPFIHSVIAILLLPAIFSPSYFLVNGASTEILGKYDAVKGFINAIPSNTKVNFFNLYANHGVIFTWDSGPFSSPSAFRRLHDSTYFQVSPKRLGVLIGFMSGSPTGKYRFYGIDKNRLEMWAQTITRDDIEAAQNHNINNCAILAPTLPYLSATTLMSVSVECFNKMIEYAFSNGGILESPLDSKVLTRFPYAWIEMNAYHLARKLNATATNPTLLPICSKIPKIFYEVILNRPENCSEIQSALLDRVIFANQNLRHLVSPQCFQSLQPGVKSAFYPRANLLVSDIYSYLTGSIHDDAFGIMTAQQAQYFGSQVTESLRCVNLRPDLMNPKAIAGLRAECLLNWLKTTTGPISLGAKWKRLGEDILDGLGDYDSEGILRKLSHEDFMHIQDAHLVKLLKKPEDCRHLPSKTFASIRRIKVNSLCFGHMQPSTQMAVFDSIQTFPNNLFRHVDANDVNSWTRTRKRNSYHGLDVLQSISATNIGKLIQNLGHDKQETTDHPCATITGVYQLSKNLLLQRHMSRACAMALKFDIKPKELALMDKNVRIKLPLEKLADGIKDWSTIEKSFLEDLLIQESVCEDSGFVNVINSLPSTLLSLINQKCFAKLSGLQNLKVETLKGLPSTITRLLTKSKIQELDVENLTDEQFGQIGVDVTLIEESGAKSISSTNINSISRLKAISAKMWNLVPDETFTAIKNKESMEAILPQNMIDWHASGVEKIPIEALIHISADQVSQLGINQRVDNPIDLLLKKEVYDKLNDKTKGAVDARKVNPLATKKDN